MVIVGRPNVGKSSVFNRLIGRRVAIVHADRGVTRDRLVHPAEWNGRRFLIVDTGGVTGLDGVRPANELEAAVRRQVEQALDEAALALVTVDVKSGLIPLDAEVARLVRARGISAITVANKADTDREVMTAAEFEALGFEVLPVSAAHGRGFDELMERIAQLVPSLANEGETAPVRVTVVGRPNVGKSSYLNRLVREERLIVTAQPGTTRDSVEIPFHLPGSQGRMPCVFVDTAGLRPARPLSGAVDGLAVRRAEQNIHRADVVLLMLDAVQGPTAQDKRIAAKVLQSGKACLLVVNKWDLAPGVAPRAYETALRQALPFLAYCPIATVSAHTGYGIGRSVNELVRLITRLHARLPTPRLTRTLREACRNVPPPLVDGRRLKVFYATQAGTAPTRLRVYVNDPTYLTESYRQYLIHAVRMAFDVEGIALRLEACARPRRGAPSKRDGDDAEIGSPQRRSSDPSPLRGEDDDTGKILA